MERPITLLTILLALQVAHAQQVISSSGGEFTSPDIRFSYTIGEPVHETVNAANTTLTQGFEQPWADISTTDQEIISDGSTITVYPNPVRHILNVAYSGTPTHDTFELRDAEGRLVERGRVQDQITELNMARYSSGLYLLHLTSTAGTPDRTFRIQTTR